MMHGNVSRLVVVSILALTTACPLDPGEGTSTSGDTNDDGSTTNDPSGVSLTTQSTSSPPTTTTSTTETSTATESTSNTDTDPSDTDSTGSTDPTMATEESGSGTTGMLEGTPATIPEIQMGDIAEDTAVEVTDAIVTAVAVNGFFMQEAAGGEYSGIWVYTGEAGPFPVLGDVVTVVGTYEEFYDLSQINSTGGGSVDITESPGEGNVPAPEALTIADLAEPWESVLVRVSDDTFTVVEVSMVMSVNEFRVEDTSADSIWVDDFMYDTVDEGDLAGFDVDATFDGIQGPLNYSFDEFKIAPRTVDDLTGYVAP